MHLLMYAFGILAIAGNAAVAEIAVAAQPRPEIEIFINEMVERHGFKQAELERILGMAQFRPAIINAISQPATSRPWHEYRPLFINSRRIAGGVAFWNSHAATLERAPIFAKVVQADGLARHTSCITAPRRARASYS